MLVLLIASLLLFTGHALRMARTRFILRNYLNRADKAYWLSLSFGYLFDFFSPIRLSDIIRSYTFARISKSPWALGLGLVIIERLADLFVLGLFFLFLGMDARFFLAAGISLLLFALGAPLLALKKNYYKASSLFNDSLKNFFLGIYWAFLRLRKDTGESLAIFIHFSTLSLIMWASYIGSVYVFSHALGVSSPADILMLQFSGLRTVGLWTRGGSLSSAQLPLYYLYLFAPIALAFLAAFLPASKKENKTMKIIPFLNSSGSLKFFERFFLGSHSHADETYYRMTHDAFCIKDLSAASEAKTFLMQGEKGLFIRKIALGGAADKLQAQYQWIVSHENLPLPKIYQSSAEPGLFSYDMEYFANGESFFTAIHRLPLETSWELIEKILSYLADNPDISSPDYMDRFSQNYIIKNYGIVKKDANISKFTKISTININGNNLPNVLVRELDLIAYVAGLEKLPAMYIHGDITIENILINQENHIMIIDPSPMINNFYGELGKLFQSLHGEYEYIKRLEEYSAENGIILYPRYASKTYGELYKKLIEFIQNKYGSKGLKAIYFYETVCHIRTMSYMVRLGKPQAVLMLALACQAYAEWEKL